MNGHGPSATYPGDICSVHANGIVNGHGPSATYPGDIGSVHANGVVNGNHDSQPTESSSSKSIVIGHPEGDDLTQNHSPVRLFLLSCFDQKLGRSQAKSLSKYLVDRLHSAEDQLLNDLAYTLGERRTQFGYKTVIAASSIPQLVERLDDEGLKFTGSSGKKALAYIFTGQGAQWYAMGRELMWTYPIFYNSLVRASVRLNIFGASWNLIGNIISSLEISPANLNLQTSFLKARKPHKWGLYI